MKKLVRLTESELKNIIIESVKSILKEEENLPFSYIRPEDDEFNDEDTKKAYDLIAVIVSGITTSTSSE